MAVTLNKPGQPAAAAAKNTVVVGQPAVQILPDGIEFKSETLPDGRVIQVVADPNAPPAQIVAGPVDEIQTNPDTP